MKIILDCDNYHDNKESKKETEYVKSVIKSLFEIHKDLQNYVDRQFNKYQPNYCDNEKNECLYKIVKGSIKEILDVYGKDVKDKLFYSELYKSVVDEFPIVLQNESSISMNRFYLYEPRAALILYCCNRMQEAVDSTFEYNDDEYTKMSLILMCHNTIRAIKGSLMMFAIGDDVHGYALYRGIIELLARITVFAEQRDDYREFNEMNMCVQLIYKHDENEKEAIATKNAFMNKYKINGSQLESFMLYGWAKDRYGNRIRTASDMIALAFPDDKKNLKELYHKASEFVHEDYVLALYNYQEMRKESKSYLLWFLVFIYQIEKEIYKFDDIVTKKLEEFIKNIN